MHHANPIQCEVLTQGRQGAKSQENVIPLFASLSLGVLALKNVSRQTPATAPDMQQQAGLSRRLAAPKSDEGGNEMKADVAQDLWGTQSRPVGTVVRRALAPTPTACMHAVAAISGCNCSSSRVKV